jgi:hypothetical protein
VVNELDRRCNVEPRPVVTLAVRPGATRIGVPLRRKTASVFADEELVSVAVKALQDEAKETAGAAVHAVDVVA